MVWTPVQQASKAFDLTAQCGITVRTRDKKQLAVRIVPTSYTPPPMPCPALTTDNLCDIHAAKPSRCRTMPFFPYREENDQGDVLVPRPGWACDTSSAAPVVYRDKAVMDRTDFDREWSEIQEQTPVLRAYGEWLMGNIPGMVDNLVRATMNPGGGHVAVSFASFLRRLEGVDKAAIAEAQLAVLGDFMARVADQPKLSDYHRNYDDWAWEIERLTDR